MKMKTWMIVVVLFLTTSQLSAQSDSLKERGFKKQNLFTGGSISAQFGSGIFGAGINPVFGYSLTKWLDAGVGFNYFYISQRYSSAIKLRQTIFGAGPFVRVFPINFLFVQGQFEHNLISYKEIYSNGGPANKANLNANSMLVGAGYATGRQSGGGSFAYFSVLFDLLNDRDSPYNTYSNEDVSRTPVVRAGIHIPLFQGKNDVGR